MTWSIPDQDSCDSCAASGGASARRPATIASPARPDRVATAGTRAQRRASPDGDVTGVDHLQQAPGAIPHTDDLAAREAHLHRDSFVPDAVVRPEVRGERHGDVVTVPQLPLCEHGEVRREVI